MKRYIYFTAMLFAITNLLPSCTNSPKSILVSGDGWLVEKPDEASENPNHQILKFFNSETLSLGDENYTISWIDEYSFKLTKEEKVVVFKFADFVNEKSKVAILYENEKLPVTEADWAKLQSEDRVMQLIKNGNSGSSPDFYTVNGKEIPIDKAPAAGLYLLNGRSDGYALNVIIKDGELSFQAGDNKNSLVDCDADIEFEGLISDYLCSFYLLNDWGSCEYIGNGVIVNSSSWFNGNSGGSVEFIKEGSSNKSADNILDDLINRASDYGYIFNNEDLSEEIVGKLVLVEFVKKSNQSGQVFNVPKGKMWTPLYFKFEDLGNNYSISIPEILTEQNTNQRVGRDYYYLQIYDDKATNTWWEKESGFYFPKQKDFQSIKLNMRNIKALADKNAIYVRGYEKNVKYIFYFFEEGLD